MKFRLASVVLLIAAMAALGTVGVSSLQPAPPSPPFVVHEWGTFTSIAAPDGTPIEWSTQGGRSDLPCFVDRHMYFVKGFLPGTIRMETPVIYFYSPRDVTVDVGVQFRGGLITEWYPRATGGGTPSYPWNGWIKWDDVRVSPSILPAFPVEPGPSHYYAARKTDATPLAASSQSERFLFYRGIAQFPPPVAATIDAKGRTTAWTLSGQPLGDVIVFDNHDGTIAYRSQRASAARATLDRPSVDDDVTGLQRELVRILIANGLYPKEADAMVATWTDSWFEEGTRLLYIVPRSQVDDILPLSISPAPAKTERVFVGRIELMSAASRDAVSRALVADDRATLEKYGRFLGPIGDEVLRWAAPMQRPVLEARLNAARSPWTTPTPSYCQ